MRERVPPLQNSKKGHQKWAASPPTLRAGFSSFGGVDIALLIVFLEVFARRPLTLAYDNTVLYGKDLFFLFCVFRGPAGAVKQEKN